jgi:hypothetical protein
MTLITGNTYPVKDQIKALGGVKWDPIRKGWLVPDDRAAKARSIVAGAGACSAPRPSPARRQDNGRWTGCSCGSREYADGSISRNACAQCRFDAE